MKFTVKKAEAVYTGGGIYVFCGETLEGYHFMASHDPNWVMLTTAKTMTTEMDNDAWNDLWYYEWQEANMEYEANESEADEWMLKIYAWLLNSKEHFDADIQVLRDILIREMEDEPNSWNGYRMSNEALLNRFAMITVKYGESDKPDVAEEWQRYHDELLRRMEDFTGEIHE